MNNKAGMNGELVDILKDFRVYYPELLSESRLVQIDNCARYLNYVGGHIGGKRLVDANFCRFKFCPICMWRKSLKIYSQISQVTYRLNNDYPSSKYIFVTLTMGDVCAEELSLAIDKLNNGFKFLVQDNAKMADSKVLKESLLGYFKCLEISYNSKDKAYYPCIQALLHLKSSYFGNKYLSHKKWVAIWRSMMKLDYDPAVNVKAIRTAISVSSEMIAEMAKYPMNTSGLLNIKDRAEQIEVLRTLLINTNHRRFVTFGGTFRDVKKQLKLDDLENGSFIHNESEKGKFNYIVYELYKYDFKFGCSIC